MTRIAYFNGKFVPETEVLIPYRDRSFNRGDGCFDMTRTFDGRIFRLAEHVDRLYRSLRYLRIDIGLEPKEVVAISEEVVLRNEHLRENAGDGRRGSEVAEERRMIPVRDARDDLRLEVLEDLLERLGAGRRRRGQRCCDVAWTNAGKNWKALRILEVIGDPIEDRAAVRDQLVALGHAISSGRS